MYHRVVKKELTDSKFNVFVTEKNLEQQIQYFLKRKYQLVTFKDLQTQFIKKPMILTFDDGYLDNYQNLYPILKKYNVKAVIFVLVNSSYNHWDVDLGEPRAELMTDEHILELSKSGLVEIASHGMNHHHLPKLNDISLNNELIESKKKIEKLLNDKVVSFAYPYGDYDEREKQAVKNSGYDFGIATVKGSAYFKDDLFEIRRVHMFPNESKVSLWKKSSGFYLRYLKIKGK
ncbi:polysaccharide deacetylase family protein [hydrothermal vent metagenome]|uniref:Polysaccharide deacetylase family protein n=1 Tax=hydrothermal vent metagenome TaxID=652676 RepID=A0A1W1BFT2_9ZZZZ